MEICKYCNSVMYGEFEILSRKYGKIKKRKRYLNQDGIILKSTSSNS